MSDNQTLLSTLAPELIAHLPVVVYVAEFDPSGTLRYVSPRITKLTGRTPEELIADQEEWYRCIHPDDVARVRKLERLAYEREEDLDCDYRFVHRDGRVFHVWERDHVVRDAAGKPQYSQGVVLDVTALRAAEAEARAERDRAQRYLDVAEVTLLAVGADGRVTMLNRAGHELLGYRDGELIGEDYFTRCLPQEQAPVLFAAYEENLAKDAILPEYESEVVCRDASRRVVAWQTTVLRDDGGRPSGVLSSGTDVTDRRVAQQQIAPMAYHDSLTGLPNRTKLRDHLEVAMARATRNGTSVALMFLDLDDFKLVNDALGHVAGDDLLREMAGRLRARLREEDVIAREGGDEFLILLADLEKDPEERAVAVGESLVDALREPVQIEGTEFEVGGSIGISLFPRDAPDAEHLLAHADTAMYEAKAAGRGCVRVFRGRRQRSSERLSLSRRLRRALERDEFVLHWQPIVDLGSGFLVGVEALVRWEDPKRGIVAAGDFLTDMERSGLMEALDEWVAAAFTAQRRAWHAEGMDPHAGLNLSPSALNAVRIERILEQLLAPDLAPDRVVIELSESAALHDDLSVRAALQRMDEAGLTLALDDFGVAYSSLARLREVPTKWIKVDKTFLRGVPERPAATRVLDAILQLLEALEVRVVVEGVENAAQVDHLRARGCEAVQGYFLCPPIPAKDVEGLLRASPDSRHQLTAPPRSAELRG